jgi:hypothetical protein
MSGLAEIEQRAGVDPIARDHAARAALVAQAAPRRALRDTFDASRKEVRSAIAALIVAEQGEMSEAKLERLASGDERYGEYLLDCRTQFAELAVLEDQITAITERIRRNEAALRYVTAEARLA